MHNNKLISGISIAGLSLLAACTLPAGLRKTENKAVPVQYASVRDSLNTGLLSWKEFFSDSHLVALIDIALRNNQELNITMQELNIARNEVRARKGEYLPFLGMGGRAGVDKRARYTNIGAMEANTDIEPGRPMPDPLPDYMLGAYASWELDIWNKLHNAKKAAVSRYLASVEGRNFMVTNLVSEIASSYYELMALDNQLDILKRNIEIQTNALEIVKLEKDAAKVTELAVRKFEAEVLRNQSNQYDIMQRITETENRINFLTGRFPQHVQRSSGIFTDLVLDTIHEGIPSQLLQNRPDIRQAEQELMATRLDVKAAKANFYPSLRLTAGIGYQAFNPAFLIKTPQSLLYSLAGELVAPLINRNAIKAQYYTANAKQVQAVYNYERAILKAYTEVVNQLSNISNLGKSYDLKARQVEALTQSIDISTGLFRSARADYMEVLMTQRDALESKFELVETKMQQMNARVRIYKALGGGWR